MNSTIIRKKKQLKCGCFDYAFSKGRCKLHATVEDTKKRAEKYAAQPTVRKAGWFDFEGVNLNEIKDETAKLQKRKSSLPISFEPTRSQLNIQDDIKEVYRSFNHNTPMGKWFLSLRPKMTGICQHCGGKTMAIDKEAETKFHWSLAHLFEKSHFPSIATHPENVLELCYYSPSCHRAYDDKILPITQLNCFDEVVRKFCILYPLMTRDEKRRVPKILLQYLDAEI